MMPRIKMDSEGQNENSNMSNSQNIERDDSFGVNHAESENNSDFNVKDLLSTHCLICDVALSSKIQNSHNIFGQLRNAGDLCARGSVFEKVGKVLNRSLHSIKLHSELICSKCFKLLIAHEKIKCKLQELEAQIEAKFNANEKNHTEERQIKVSKRAEKELCLTESERTNEFSTNTECLQKDALLMKKQGTDKLRKAAKFPRLNKPYICSICGKIFRAFSHRVEHMLIHLDEKPWSCKECLKNFRTKSALRVHEVKHSGVRPYSCQHCSKSFLDRYYFEEHQRIHSGERPFACTFCTRLFTRKKDLSVHTKSHTGDKPYKCSSCTKTFAVKSRLDRHMKIHSGERPYSCEHCSKSFARSDDYQVHMRTHTGERPFQCALCNRTFTNKSNCLVHVRLHQNSKHYQGSVCKVSFKQKVNMDEHLKMHRKANNASSEGDCPSGETVTALQNQAVFLQSLDEVVHESQQLENGKGLEDHSAFAQPMLQLDTLQNVTVTHIPPLQSLPVTEVTHLNWGEITASASTTFVNIMPGAYVSIV